MLEQSLLAKTTAAGSIVRKDGEGRGGAQE